MLNGSGVKALESAHDLLIEEDEEMADQNQRIFDKIDQVQASVSTMMADVARTQGSQKGIEIAIDTVKEAIGDVTATKLEVRETKTKLDGLERDLKELKQSLETRNGRDELRGWVEPLVRWAVAALAAGGGLGAGSEIVKRLL